MRRSVTRCGAVGFVWASLAVGAAFAQGQGCAPSAVQAAKNATNGSAASDASAHGASSVTPAKLVHTVSPTYQPAADGSSAGGTVVLKYTIQVDGTVSDVEYLSGPAELKDLAIAAVKQWVYEPARVSGHAVPSDGSVNLVFKGSPPLTSGDADDEAKPSPPVAAPPTAGADATKPVRIAGNVIAKQIVHQVQPIYPGDAKMARVQGTVVMHAILAKDGTVRDLKYVSGPQDLVNASITAVKQWRYRPTTLNGQAVEVDTTISIVFTLG